MTTNYHISVWRKALADAESDVMRATAIPTGGRKPDEDLMDFVDRARTIQDAAIARWFTARDEVKKLREAAQIRENSGRDPAEILNTASATQRQQPELDKEIFAQKVVAFIDGIEVYCASLETQTDEIKRRMDELRKLRAKYEKFTT